MAIGPGAVLKTDESGYVVSFNGKSIQHGKSTNNTNITPHQSDVTVSEGPDAGAKILQIFQVQGDVLIACQSKPGMPRPTEFKCEPGSGRTLSVWLRISEQEANQNALAAQNPLIWGLFVIALGFTDGIRHDLMENLGYWPGVLAAGLFAAVLMMVIGLTMKLGWRKGFALGITLSSGYFAFEELRTTIEQSLGRLGATLVAACAAFVLAAIVGQIFSRLLKVRWN